MTGTTFVHAPDAQELRRLAGNPAALHGFSHVSLASLATIDFVVLCARARIGWCAGDPVVDAADGLFIFPELCSTHTLEWF